MIVDPSGIVVRVPNSGFVSDCGSGKKCGSYSVTIVVRV